MTQQTMFLKNTETFAESLARCGVKFHFAYPITPATDVMKRMAVILPQDAADGKRARRFQRLGGRGLYGHVVCDFQFRARHDAHAGSHFLHVRCRIALPDARLHACGPGRR